VLFLLCFLICWFFVFCFCGENYHKQTLEKTKKSNQERTIQRYWAQEMERGQTKYPKQTSKQTNLATFACANCIMIYLIIIFLNPGNYDKMRI
jgi:hypothetical protein